MRTDGIGALAARSLTLVLVVCAVVCVPGAWAQGTRSLSAADGWRQNTWAGDGDLTREGSGEGTVFRTASRGGADFGWLIEVPIEPGMVYRLSGEIRTEGLDRGTGRGALLSAQGFADGQTDAVRGDSGWTRVSTVFRSGERDEMTVICLFGGWGQSTGQAWYRNIELEEIDLSGLRPAVTINAGDTRDEMNEMIYGQFIEHMGRCINGGIWAEMLEDRKFYFPVTGDYDPYSNYKDTDFPAIASSPWQIRGSSTGVTMTEEDPFVGRHAPVIADGTAIRQRDLGVVKGRAYNGYVWVRRASGSPVVTVGMSTTKDGVSINANSSSYGKHEFTFVAEETTDAAELSIGVRGGSAVIGTVSLMPADNINGLRADVMELLKELDSPIYRWPGGNFVSGYDWRDGIGDRDRRPPRTNPAWTGIEPNDFGMHEFIEFCEILDTEPLITINMGYEGLFSAQAEFEYANGTEGFWAEKRAENGAEEPFGVKYWCIGNEMWGDWQLGFMSPEDYQIKHNWVVENLREDHPDFVSIGSGNAGAWSRGLLERCAENMDLIAEHFYTQSREDVASHVRLVPDAIRGKADFHRSTQGSMDHLRDEMIPIAMTEWNYWYGPFLYGELGTVYYLRDALGIAAGIHEYSRQSDVIEAAFYAQTVNVIGAIKTTRTDAFLAATALPLIMYRAHFGTIPVELEAESLDLLGLDIAAAWTEDRSALTIGVVNANGDPVTVDLGVEGASLARTGEAWRFSGNDPMLYNEAGRERLSIEHLERVRVGDSVTVPGYSATVFRVPVR